MGGGCPCSIDPLHPSAGMPQLPLPPPAPAAAAHACLRNEPGVCRRLLAMGTGSKERHPKGSGHSATPRGLVFDEDRNKMRRCVMPMIGRRYGRIKMGQVPGWALRPKGRVQGAEGSCVQAARPRRCGGVQQGWKAVQLFEGARQETRVNLDTGHETGGIDTAAISQGVIRSNTPAR